MGSEFVLAWRVQSGRSVFGVLLPLIFCFATSGALAAGNSISDSASAKITLRISPRTQLQMLQPSGQYSLCLYNAPARQVSIHQQGAQEESLSIKEVNLASSGPCLNLQSVTATNTTVQSVMIAAE